MIDLPPQHLATVRRILSELVPGLEVRAFGSRVSGNARRHSDLDLVVVGPERLPRTQFYRLKEAFEASDLPVRVDVIDWNRTFAGFQAVIEKCSEVVQVREETD
jgi:type I restriction enzyme S subunit